jgi:hypothetical protein
MIHFNLNTDVIYRAFDVLGRRRTKCPKGVLHWASAGPKAWLGMPWYEWMKLLVEVNRPRGTGYSAVVSEGILYISWPWRRVTQHCGGSDRGWTNTASYGVSILYPGPSRKPRGIPGETLGPHTKLGEAWYPPISDLDILHAAWAFRRIRDDSGLEEVKGHWEINGAKNDPRPIDMDRFRELVFNDAYWSEELRRLVPPQG